MMKHCVAIFYFVFIFFHAVSCETFEGVGINEGTTANNDSRIRHESRTNILYVKKSEKSSASSSSPIYKVVEGVRIVENQTFTDTLTIDSKDWDNAIIRNNIFMNQSDKGLHISNVHNLLIENNEFFGMQSNAIKLRDDQKRGTYNVTIKGNNFHDINDTPILVGEPNIDTKITNNRFENVALGMDGNKKHAVYLKGPDFLVEGNTIVGVRSANGVSARTAGTVRGNLIMNNASDGIKYYSSSRVKGSGILIIENNVVVNNGHGGITFSSGDGVKIDRAIVRFNTVVNNSRGMWIYENLSSIDIQIYGNIFIEGNEKYLYLATQPSLNKDNLTDSSDIGFVNFAEHNFKLTQSSKARNFVSSIPDVPPYDFSGNPMGSEPFDAGAYQYQ